MKKIIVVLFIVFIIILLLGFNYVNTPAYDERQIEKVNRSIKTAAEELSSKNDEEAVKNMQKIEEKEDIDDIPPSIDVVYPSNFNDGDTVVTRRVQLAFSDNKKVVNATMNERPVDTDEITINTEGTYYIVVVDEAENENTLNFTIDFPKTQSTNRQESIREDESINKDETSTEKEDLSKNEEEAQDDEIQVDEPQDEEEPIVNEDQLSEEEKPTKE